MVAQLIPCPWPAYFLSLRKIRKRQKLMPINHYLSCIQESAQEKYFCPFLLLQCFSEDDNCESEVAKDPVLFHSILKPSWTVCMNQPNNLIIEV